MGSDLHFRNIVLVAGWIMPRIKEIDWKDAAIIQVRKQ